MNISAFPINADRGEKLENSQGMTLRDYFAAKAMHSILTTYPSMNLKEMAAGAYFAADAMLAEREK